MSQSWASITSSSAGVQLDVAAGVSEKARADAALFRRLDGVGSTLAEHEACVGALDGILCWQKQDDNLLVIFAAYLAASGLSSVAGVIEQASVADAERSAAPSAAAERAAWSTPFFDEMAAAMSKMTLSAAGPTWREIVAAGGAEIMLAKRKLTPPQVAETMQAILGNPDVQRLDVSYNAGCFESAAAVAALVEVCVGVVCVCVCGNGEGSARTETLPPARSRRLPRSAILFHLSSLLFSFTARDEQRDAHCAGHLRDRDLALCRDVPRQGVASQYDVALREPDQLQECGARAARALGTVT
jgi:hypothetical protein